MNECLSSFAEIYLWNLFDVYPYKVKILVYANFWQIFAIRSNKLCFCVKWSLILPDLNLLEVAQQIFLEFVNIKFN